METRKSSYIHTAFMTTSIFQFVGHTLDNATLAYVVSTAGRVVKNITPIAISGVGFFITLYGYLILSGRVQEPFSDFMYLCIKIILVSAFALHTPLYLDGVVSAMYGLQSGLASTLSHSNPSADIYQTLDSTLDKGLIIMQKFVELAQKEGFTNIGKILFLYFNAGVMAFGTLVLLLTGGMIVLTATVMLKIMFAIGPFFILCLMWPVTAKFFDAWFAQVMTYVLKTAFVAVVIAFAISIFNALIATIDPNKMIDGAEMLAMTLEIMIASFLLYKLMLEVSGMASGLAGGIASSAMRIGNVVSFSAQGRKRVQMEQGKFAIQGDQNKTQRQIEQAHMATPHTSIPLYQIKTMEKIQNKHTSEI